MNQITEVTDIAGLREQARQCRIIGLRYYEHDNSALYELADAIEAQADRLERLVNDTARGGRRAREHCAGILRLNRHAAAAW